MKFIYNFFMYVLLLLKGLTKKKKFIILIPKFIAKFLKKIIIYSKINNLFFVQHVRNDNDIDTVYEIFGNQDYDLTKYVQVEKIKKKNKDKKKLILDCGSNIGSSSYFFSQHYSDAKIISIEPEGENFSQLKKNFISEKAEYICSAVSSEEKSYNIVHSDNSRAFKIDFETSVDKEKNIAITINKVLRSYNDNEYYPFIIKIDIEGSEDDLFSKNTEWVEKFDIIIIELHDWMLPFKANSMNFLETLSASSKLGKKRDLIISGENLICIKN